MSRDFDNKKPGTGVAFPPRNGNGNGPAFKGHIILPSGEVVGLAIWEKRSQGGNDFLSISIDDREGEYQARKLGLPQMRLSQGEPRREDARGYRAEDRPQRGGRDDDYKRGGAADQRQFFNDDLDDEIPF